MILVGGATGLLGGMITHRLLQQKRDVRVLVRRDSPSEQLAPLGLATKQASLVQAGARPVVGDLRDAASLQAAVRGVDVIITTANSSLRGGGDNPRTVDFEGNVNLVNAALQAGVKQFIFISSLIADADSPLPFLQSKGLSERYLRESGVPYTILAPNSFMEMWIAMVVGLPALAGQPVTLVGKGQRKHAFVSMRDVAAFAVAAVGHPAARNRYLAIGGPEALSWREAVAAFEQVLGRRIPIQTVAPGGEVPGLPADMARMMAGYDLFDSPVPMAETVRTFGVQLTPLASYAQRILGSAQAS